MPWKQNPMRSERICSLARFVIALVRRTRALVFMSGELVVGERVVAVEDVVLRTSGEAPLPGAGGAGQAKGLRVLKARKLDLWFRGDRTLQEATASPDADLVVMPGPGEPPEQRRVRAKVLAFRFDELGRLVDMHAQRDALVSVLPTKPGKGVPRTVTARNSCSSPAPLAWATKPVVLPALLAWVALSVRGREWCV